MNDLNSKASYPEGSGRSSMPSAEVASRASTPAVAKGAVPSGTLLCENGVTRTFGSYDIGLSGLVSGWAAPEEAHVWNDGPEVVLKACLPAPSGAIRVTVDGTPFLNASRSHQDVTLYANGFFVGFWRLTEEKDYQITAVLEPEQLFHRDGMAIVKLVWFMPDSVRPSDISAGSDTRELGFCFRFLSLAVND